MARRPEGWTLSVDPRTKIQIVRFTHDKRPYKLSTGERDPGRAALAAARIYAEVVTGVRASDDEPGEATPSAPRRTLTPLDVLFSQWLADVEATLDETTVDVYTTYVKAHWLDFFKTLDAITEASASAYVRARLRKVKRKTVLKELSGLRGFLAWCKTYGHLDQVPTITSPARTATGTEYDGGKRKKVRVELSEEEVERILAALPERTRKKLPARAYFVTMYETTLRRETLFSLKSPGDYAKGRTTLRIRDEADKARFGREVPLSDAARAALDSVCPEEGLIFPRASYRYALYQAAKAAGLAEERARHLSYHDLRHAALTHLASVTTDLAGMAYLAGHKQITTTAQYVHASQKAAERALAARKQRS